MYSSYTILIQYTIPIQFLYNYAIPCTIHIQFTYHSYTIDRQFIYNTQFLVQFINNSNTIQIQFKFNSYTIHNLYTIHIKNKIYVQFIYKYI